MKWQTMIAGVAVLASASSAFSHPGPRIWISIDSGKVTTYEGPYPAGDPANYMVSGFFAFASQPLEEFEGDDVWATDFPGFEKVPGGQIPVGTTFKYNLAGPLLWYNPGDDGHCPFYETVAEQFESTPPVPQMAVNNEVFQIVYTTDGFVPGDDFFEYDGGDGNHHHLTYTLLGDGVTPGGGPDGIYALPLQITAAGVLPSDTFYLLLAKNAPDTQIVMARVVIEDPREPPDLDCDGDVDLEDLQLFELCMAGPADSWPVRPGLEQCPRADLDGDFHIDVRDFSLLQMGWTMSEN